MMVTLEQMMGGDPGAFFERQGAWNTQQQKSQADLASLMQQTQQRGQMFPLEMRRAELGNLTSEAQLPGVKADSRNRELDTKKKELLFDDDMKASFGKMKAEEAKRYVDQLSQAANAYTVGGQYLANAPGGATHEMAKQVLGPLYRPEFDKITPEALGGTLFAFGKSMSEVMPKFQQEMDLLAAKNQFNLNKELMKQEAAARLAEYKGNIQKAVAQIQATKNPTTIWGAYVKMQEEMYAAAARGENDRAAVLNERMNEMITTYGGIEKLKADARKAGEIDTGAVSGLETKPPAVVPRVPMPGGAQTPRSTGGAIDQTNTNPTAIFERAFGAYEPDKYDYRISPEGKPQRKLKGQ